MEPSFCINHDEERNKFARRVAGMTEHISSKTKNSEIVLLLPSFPPLTHDPFMINFIIFFAFVISIKSHSLIGSFSSEKIFNPYKGLSYFRGESREFIPSHSNKPLVSKTVFKMLFMSLLSLTKKRQREMPASSVCGNAGHFFIQQIQHFPTVEISSFTRSTGNVSCYLNGFLQQP